MYDELPAGRDPKPVLLVVLGVVAVGLCALAATILATFATKYLIMVCAAAAGSMIFLLCGNPRLFLLYGLLFFGTIQAGKKVMGVDHAGGATGFDIIISDPFLIGLLAFQLRDWMGGYRRPYRVPAIVWPWLGLMGLGLIDVATENYKLPAAHELWRMGRTLLWVLVITNEIVRRRQFMHVVIALIMTATFHGVIAVVKDVMNIQLGLEHYGELSAEGIRDLGTAALAGESGVRRVSGLLGHPILLGGYLVMVLSVGFALLFAPLRLTAKLLIGAAAAFGSAVVVMTLSRGAWMDYVIAFAGVITLTLWHPGTRSRYFLVRSAMVAGVLFLVLAFSGQIVSRIQRADESSASSRWEFMVTAMDMVKAKPVFGFGLNNYVFDQYPYTKFGTVNEMTKRWGEFHLWPVVHSTWLIVWSEQGTVGLLLFAWLHVIVIRSGLRNLAIRDPMLNALNVGLLCAVFAIMADGIVSFLFRTPMVVIFFTVVAMIMALEEWRRVNEPGGVPAPARVPNGAPAREAATRPGRPRWLPAAGAQWAGEGGRRSLGTGLTVRGR